MNGAYHVSTADEKKGRCTGPMFPSDVLLKTIIDDRERSIHERLRTRQQAEPRPLPIRWRSGNRPLSRHDRGQDF